MMIIQKIKLFSKKISSLDFIGYQPKLLYRGQPYSQTFFGGVFSAVSVGFLISFSLYFLVQLFERNNSNVSTNSDIVSQPVYNASKFPFIFKLIDVNLNDLPNDTSIFSWGGIFTQTKGFAAFNFSFEACDIDNPRHFGVYRSFFENVEDISNYTCVDDIDKYNFTLYGLYDDNEHPNSYINVILQFCQNLTGYPICKPKAQINAFLASVYVKFLFLDYTVDHRNILSPGNLILQTQLFPFSSTFFKRYYMYKSLIQYETDYGDIFPEVETKTFFHQAAIDISVDLRVQTGAVKFGHITILLNKEQTTYFRKFTKIQELIASIGGILSAIVYGAGLLVRLITKRIFLINLANDSYVNKSKDMKKRISMSAKKHIIYSMVYKTEFEQEKIAKRPAAPKNKQKISFEKDHYKENSLEKFENIHKCIDKNGKIKVNLKNIIWPNKTVCKIYEMMEKKCGIDEMMKHCSQMEKIKKYLFSSEDELQIFNELPDLDMVEILKEVNNKFGDIAGIISKVAESNPDAKILEMIEKI